MSRTEIECRHVVKCYECRAASVEFHEAGVAIVSWAAAIADLARRVGEEETIDAATPLLDAIEGLAWGIGSRANADIEAQTFETMERGPMPAPRIEAASGSE